MRPKAITMLNDLVKYNEQYRRPLIEALTFKGYDVSEVGILERKPKLPILAIKLYFKRNDLVFSSNLKSNAFALLFSRSPKVVIVNGLGRHRKKRSLRFVFRKLIGLRTNSFAIVQNYADYRYIKRYCPNVKAAWLPGSGGTYKKKGENNSVLVVQRDSKIAAVAPSINDFLVNQGQTTPLVVVGCKDSSLLNKLFPEILFRSTGYVEGADIFSKGSIFLQPTGYGEGFPHTLADAIVSDMGIYISNKEYIRYGLWLIGAKREHIAPGWSRMTWDVNLPDRLHSSNIVERTLNIVESHVLDSYPE